MEKPPNPESDQNLYETSRERQAFREAVKDEKTPESVRLAAKKEIEEIREGLKDAIKKEGDISETKERFKKEKTESEKSAKVVLDEKAIMETMGESADAYESIKSLSEGFESLNNFEMRRSLEMKSDPYAKRVHEKFLEAARKER